MENITKGYASTYDDRNDYPSGRNYSICCKHDCACNGSPVAKKKEIDIKKATAPRQGVGC